MSNNHQRAIYNLLTEKTIAYNAGLAKALESVKAGIFIAQFLYWQGKGFDKNWVYKTADEIYEETGLTKKEQRNAIKKCKEKGVLEVKLARIPAVNHFRVDIEKLIDLISRLDKRAQLDLRKSTNSILPKVQSNTYSTHKNTSDINKFFFKESKELANKFRIK